MTNLISVLLVFMVFIAPALGAGFGILRGVAEHSYDSKKRLLRTDRFVFQFSEESLSESEKESLARPGGQVSLTPRPGLIERAWPATVNTFTADSSGPSRVPVPTKDALAVEGDALTVRGRVIPLPSENAGLITVGEKVFQFRKDGLVPAEREKFERLGEVIVLHAPQKSLEYAWDTLPVTEGGRSPAQVFPPGQQDFVQWHGGRFTIAGTYRYSFAESSVLVQSGDGFYEVRQSALEGAQVASAKLGSRVVLEVPAEALVLAWTTSGMIFTPLREFEPIQ